MEILTALMHNLKRYYRSAIGALVLIIAFIAALLIAHEANRTILLWASAHELSTGAVIEQSDLVPIRALLPENSRSYFNTRANLLGAIVTTHIGEGELVPISGLIAQGTPVDGRYVPLEVSSHDLPTAVSRGSIVDIYALSKNSLNSTPSESAQLVAMATTVIAVDRKGDLTGRVGVVVNVREPNVNALLTQIASHRILLVQHV